MRLFLAALIFSGGAFAQQQTSAVSPSQAMTDDQIAALFSRISQRAAQIEPMLEQLHPKEWIAKGAPDAYLAQWNSLVEQYRDIQGDMAALTQQPNQLTNSMRALFRVQATHLTLESLMGGVRKYQNPALAELIESVASEVNGDIDRLEKHVLEMADEKEQQFALVDREAQRCRSTLSRQPAAPARADRKPQ